MDGTINQSFGPFELPAEQPRRIPHSLANQIANAAVSRAKAKRRAEFAPNLPQSIDIDLYLNFAEHLESSRRIVCLVGAGLSAGSGIGTFLGAGGIWRNLEVRKLASKKVFEDDPALIWWLYTARRREALEAKPNRGHFALSDLARKMGDSGMITVCQNIDDLCRRVDQPDSSTIYIHGSMFDIKCSKEGCTYRRYDQEDPIVPPLALPTLALSDPNHPLPDISLESLPHCPECSSILRPGVVWFGESLPPGSIEQIHEWLGPVEGPGARKVDLVLVVGTSGLVYPAAAIVNESRERGARVCVVNPDPESVEMIGGLDEGDWWFKENAEAALSELFKSRIG